MGKGNASAAGIFASEVVSMKAAREQQRVKWCCDRCHSVTDTLYFAGKQNICGKCREEDRRRSHGLVERGKMHVYRMAK